MSDNTERPTGLTRDTGYQIGVRRTVDINHQQAWRLLTAPSGLDLWLGATQLEFVEGTRYRLTDGTVGQVRVVRPDSHLRITWQPKEWSRASTIQVRVIPKGNRSVIAFHQEHLPGAAERAARRTHFRQALDDLERAIEAMNAAGGTV